MRVQDILEAIQKIQQYTKEASLASLQEDEKTVDAVVRNLTVIGEATRHVPIEIQTRYPAIPWEDMRDMQNVVVHEYFRVSYPILWRTIQSNLPPLVEQLESLLETEHGTDRGE
jgi:uncharacterized protein with HEPN domain